MIIYTHQYDFPDYIGPPKKIIYLYFIHRSGSNFLAGEMRKTKKLGYPLEYFAIPHIMIGSKRFMSEVNILLRARTSPNGVFGFKWNAWFDEKFKQPFDESTAQKYSIFIDRKDKVKQAESFFIAKKHNDWVSSRTKYNEVISQRDIQENINLLSGLRRNTLKMLLDSKRKYLMIYYEDFILRILFWI